MFREAVIEALTRALGADAAACGDLGALLAPPPKVEMGDLAFPCFALAKSRRAAPPKIAADLAAAIQDAGLAAGGAIAEVKALGPYVNFFADPVAELQGLCRAVADGSFFAATRTAAPQRVMIEFSQPNTHKVFHVGHLRNVAVGDALVRIFRARGHDVVAANYYGDFGIDVAKCLYQLGTGQQGSPPAEGRTAWLGEAYVAANAPLAVAKKKIEEAAAAEDDEAKQAAIAAHTAIFAPIRAVLTALETGDPETMALYRETRQWCLDEFARIYAWLGVQFDHDFFESEVEEEGARLVDEYLAKGVFVESRGAIIADLEADGLPVALVRKSDGSSLYLTWDLALARRKFDEFGIETSIYVVGAEQTLHFQQLFAALAKMGYARAKDCRHIAYELVMLPSGKMSSRNGTAIPLHELRTRVTDAIRAKMEAEARPERAAWSETQWQATIERVAIACLKYGMLKVGTTRRVIFDIEDWTNPEGDTGAYLLYSLARIAGIQRKAEQTVALDADVPAGSGFGNDAERALVGHLQRYGAEVARAEETCDPSGLAAFLFDGAKHFSRFYQECPVLQAEPALRKARLMLAAATQAVFTRALDLLGIEPVEAM
ncbi:MAG: arginine--tRNA ligase [Planctomycetota bacterium]|nr:arginine--tRNA ligase [Planctomycetota bacterium]